MQFARPSHHPRQPGHAGAGGHDGFGHPPAQGCPVGPTPGRLTLLLSTAPWRPSPWAEALPAVLAPMGVQAVRASSARQAERIIRTTPVHIAVIDLSTPLDDAAPFAGLEEAGTRILELLCRLEQAPPTVVLKCPRQSRDEHRQVNHALRCNAFAVVDRTAADLELMLSIMQRAMLRFYQGRWPHQPAGDPLPPPPLPPSGIV